MKREYNLGSQINSFQHKCAGNIAKNKNGVFFFVSSGVGNLQFPCADNEALWMPVLAIEFLEM